jgi:hypothetical protein
MAVAVATIGQTLVSFFSAPSIVMAFSILVAMLFALLILFGSRFAWVVILIGTGGELVNSAVSLDLTRFGRQFPTGVQAASSS